MCECVAIRQPAKVRSGYLHFIFKTDLYGYILIEKL